MYIINIGLPKNDFIQSCVRRKSDDGFQFAPNDAIFIYMKICSNARKSWNKLYTNPSGQSGKEGQYPISKNNPMSNSGSSTVLWPTIDDGYRFNYNGSLVNRQEIIFPQRHSNASRASELVQGHDLDNCQMMPKQLYKNQFFQFLHRVLMNERETYSMPSGLCNNNLMSNGAFLGVTCSYIR